MRLLENPGKVVSGVWEQSLLSLLQRRKKALVHTLQEKPTRSCFFIIHIKQLFSSVPFHASPSIENREIEEHFLLLVYIHITMGSSCLENSPFSRTASE